MNIQVTKRKGEKEEFDAEKINKVLLWATQDLTGVSASDIAMNANIQFYNGIKTEQIHKVLVESAVNLINEKTPNYQYVAGNLLNYLLRKEVFNGDAKGDILPHLYNVIVRNTELDFYDRNILENYTAEEISILDLYIKHKRDYNFTYAALQQLIDKYLVKDRTTNKSFETPQYAYMLIAMCVFMSETNQDLKLERIKELYDLLSLQKISLATPVIAGIRTPNRQYSSCVLIETGDNLDSIIMTNAAITKYVSKRAGIGVNIARIRAMGDKIRNGEVAHTGVIPFLRQIQGSVHSCSQGGLRKGAATLFEAWWHREIEDILVLKNNKGTDDNRVRHLDYGIQFNKLFYKRFINNETVTLFSPKDVPGLYDVMHDNDKFTELYEKYEKVKKINKKVVNARELMNTFAQERISTGRLYVMNMDNININSPFKEQLTQSNLCMEILLPVKSLKNIYDIDSNSETEHLSEGEIALCVLAAHNLGNIKGLAEMYKCSEYIVRILDFVISHQDYPINAAKKMLKRRSIGVGVINFAYWLAKQDLKYSTLESLVKVDELFEHLQYSLLTASNKLAQEVGACEWFDKTTYSEGILPIDRYNKNVDEIVQREYSCDWELLRSNIKEYGLRNSTVSCQFPSESSSVLANATNGIEPVKSLVTTKRSKSGLVKQVVPEILKLKNKYELAYDMPDNKGYTNICAVIQKWMDQSISANHYYHYSPEGISISGVIKDILYAYKMGLKTLYYANTDDKKTDGMQEIHESEMKSVEDDETCSSGACAL